MALPFCAAKNMHNASHCLISSGCKNKAGKPTSFPGKHGLSRENRAGKIFFLLVARPVRRFSGRFPGAGSRTLCMGLRIKKSTQNVPIQKNGFFRHRGNLCRILPFSNP